MHNIQGCVAQLIVKAAKHMMVAHRRYCGHCSVETSSKILISPHLLGIVQALWSQQIVEMTIEESKKRLCYPLAAVASNKSDHTSANLNGS